MKREWETRWSVAAATLAVASMLSLFLVGTPCARGDLEQGLVGHWTFDEGSGDIAHDSTANQNHAIVYGGASWGQGICRGALCFDGVDDYAVAEHVNPAQLTVASWVKWSHFDTSGGGVGWLSNACHTPREGYLMYGCVGPKNNRFSYFVTTTSGCWGESVDVLLKVNTWYHFAVTYDGDIMRAYVNGDPVVQDDRPSGPVLPTTNPLIFGKAYEPNNPWSIEFHGWLDDARIYDRALSDLEVYDLYVSTPEPASLALLALGVAALTRRRI